MNKGFVVVLLSLIYLYTFTGFKSYAYDPFHTSSSVSKGDIKKKVFDFSNTKKPKTVWVLPQKRSSDFKVLGRYGKYYIVQNKESRHVFLWRKGRMIDKCIIRNMGVECYEKKTTW